MVIRTLSEALRSGFTIYDKNLEGYVVRRMRHDSHWEMAFVPIAFAAA